MSNDPYPDLLFPTCAEAAGIGIASIPDLLWDMEDDCGAEVMKAMVLAFGGREIAVAEVRNLPFDRSHVQIGLEWLHERLGCGRIRLPKGPGARSARVAWTAYHILRGGGSLSAASLATGCDIRAIGNIKRKLRAIGALHDKDSGK